MSTQPSTFSAPPDVRKILFVQENVAYYEMLRKVFSAWSRESWQFFHAPYPGKALTILDDHLIDLVIVDQNLTSLDGLQFLKFLKRRYPGVRKAVLTSEPDEDKKSVFIAAGVDLYLEKPASIDGMESVYTTLNELARWRSEQGFRGMVHGVKLKTILQMVCFEGSSAVLEIAAGEIQGKIFVQDGVVRHAETRGHSGETALGLILAFENGFFTLGPLGDSSPGQTLNIAWNELDNVPIPEVEVAEPEMAAGTKDAASNAGTAAPVVPSSNGLAPEITEMLVCSARGDVLFDSQCADPTARAHLLADVAQKSEALTEILPLGRFNQLEVESSDSRTLFHAKPNGLVFVELTRMKGDLA